MQHFGQGSAFALFGPRQFRRQLAQLRAPLVNLGFQRLRQAAQRCVHLLARGDVADHDAEFRCPLRVPRRGDRQVCPPRWLVDPLHPQVARARRTVCDNPPMHQIPGILVFIDDELTERPIHHRRPRHVQQRREREVALHDQPRLADGAIAHRRHVVEVEPSCARGVEIPLRLAQFLVAIFQILLCPAQFLVLHFQLDLMHAQLMQDLLQRFRRRSCERCLQWRRSVRAQTRLRQ